MRDYKMLVQLVDEVKGIAKTEVITNEPIRAVAEYVLLYDPPAFDAALIERLKNLKEEVVHMVDGNTVVFGVSLLKDRYLRLEVAITVHKLTKLELVEEMLLEAGHAA